LVSLRVSIETGYLLGLCTGVLISSLPDQEGNKLGSMLRTRAISKHRDASCHQDFFFLQGKAPKKIHAILTQTLASFLPGRAKDLSAPLYNQTTHWNSEGLPHNHKFHRRENFRPTLKIRFLWERVHCRLADSYPVSAELAVSTFSAFQ